MSRVTVFSGGADYVDPWHPFADTSRVVARELADDGHDVEIVDTLPALESRLPRTEVLVVNAGGGPDPHPLDDRFAELLDAYRGPLLALHVASTLRPLHDEWERTIGGRWVRGVTMHPPGGAFRLRTASDAPIVDGLERLDTVDEAYCFLRVDPAAEVLLVHDHTAPGQPVCWRLERDGRRTAYSALGHDLEAYESPLPRELVARLVRWLADAPER